MLKKLLASQLRINMASGVVVTVINVVAMMVAFSIYLHFLGYERYGVWLVLATVLSFAQLGNLGIGQAVIKLVAEEYAHGDIEGIQRYVTTALALLFLSGTVVLIVVLVFKTQIIAAFKLSDENAKMVSWLVPYIGILSIYVFIVQVLNATLSGLGRMDLANYTQSVGRIVAVTVASILLYSGRGIESLLIGSTLSYVFIHVVSLICTRRIVHIRLLRISNLDTQRGKRILRFGSRIFGGSVVAMLGVPFNKLMLLRYAGVDSLPVFEIAFRGAMQIRDVIEVAFRALMPEVSRISSEVSLKAANRIRSIKHRTMLLLLSGGLPLYVVLFLLAGFLLRLWLGKFFLVSILLAFRLMLAATFISLLGVPAYHLLTGMGKVRHIFVARCITWLSNFVFIITISLCLDRFSPILACVCLIASWSFSSSYLIWTFHFAMRDYAETTSPIDKRRPDYANLKRQVL